MNVATVLSGDSKLAGVRWLLLGAIPRVWLRRELGALLSLPDQLGQCQLRRATFKPGRRLTGFYDVSFRNGDGPHAIRPVAVTWGASAEREKGEAGQDVDGILRQAGRHGVSAPFRQLQVQVPDWDMKIRVSPLDVEFPQLVSLSNPMYVREMLTEAYGAAEGAQRESTFCATNRRKGPRVARCSPSYIRAINVTRPKGSQTSYRSGWAPRQRASRAQSRCRIFGAGALCFTPTLRADRSPIRLGGPAATLAPLSNWPRRHCAACTGRLRPLPPG